MNSTLVEDLRYAVRMFRKWPGFTLMALITLGLGVGVNSAVFSVVNTVLLRSLPYAEPWRLVVVWETDQERGTRNEGASVPDFFDWRAQARSFEGLAAHQTWTRSLTGKGDPERITGAAVTPNFFDLLGVRPALGRSFAESEGTPKGAQVAVVSHSFWMRQLGGWRNAVGTSITLDGAPYQVIGVMPESFVSPGDRAEAAWTALQASPTENSRGRHTLLVFGWLKPGTSIAVAQADMDVISRRLEQAHPQENKGRGARVQDLRETDVGEIRPALLVLFSAVGLVLLIACVNVANAMLARSIDREREVTIRTALGAARGRLVRQFLTESLLLSFVGGALGLLLAVWGVRLVKAFGPASIPRLDTVSIDGPVLAFTFVVVVLTGVFFGLLPALHLSRPNLQAALKEGSNTLAPRRRLQSVLVIGEVALAVILTIGAGLLVKTFVRLQNVDPGFNPHHLLKVDLDLPSSSYPRPETYPAWPQVTQFYAGVVDRVRALPGVESAAIGLNHPLKPGWTTTFTIDGRAEAPDHHEEARIRPVTPGYFRTVQQRLLAGRDLEMRDDAKGPAVVLINEAMRRHYFPSEDPLGKQVSFWGTSRKIVGVVGDAKFMGLAVETEPAIYPPLMQVPMNSMSLLVRFRGDDPAATASAARKAIWGIDRSLAISEISTMDEVLEEKVSQPRFNMILLGVFAVLALTLAVVGIYGLILYSVGQQTREIGVRMALGAQRGDVLKLVVGRGMTLVVIGLVLGLLGSVALMRLISGLLFGVNTNDIATFATVCLVLGLAGLLACSIPALRAARTDPTLAIRLWP